MARDNPHRPFTPDPAQMAQHPGVSGNAINGLGEAVFRRPEVVYWAPEPDDIPHGRMQRWFYSVRPDEPALVRARAERQVILDRPMPEVTGAPAEQAPAQWTEALERFAADGTCERVGVAEMREEWLFEGQETGFARVIVLAVQHDYDEIARAPAPEAAGEVIRQYGRAAGAAKAVAGWLRQQGWEAEPVTGRWRAS